MKIYELTITFLLKRNIPFQGINESLGSFINQSMLHDDQLSHLHRQIGFKHYVFSAPFPVETKTKMYQEGKIYVFRMRSLKKMFMQKMATCIRKQKDPLFQIIALEQRTYGKRVIQELYTATPFVVTVDGGPWLQQSGDLDLLIKRLNDNANKQYQDVFHEELSNINFIQRIEFVNQKPLAMNYKNVRLLGNKVRITVNSDVDSQKLAYTVLGSGLAEKGSALGAGFCLVNFI